ncbi:MAG: tetratricopeptide repeat protein [Candidatus Obscuribacterales bacterium]|nr:tetratricopeptide repeat protein [Candidatus Obscuribacterales bacterium]
MRKYFITSSCAACLLYLSLSPALAISNEASFIREFRNKAVQAQFNNDYEGAIGHYQEALNLATQTYGANSPFLAEIYYDMGSLAFTNSKFPSAGEWLNKAIKLNPNSSSSRLKLAELEALRGHPEEAVRQASIVVSKHNDDAVAHQQLAIAFDKSDDSLRAIREFGVAEQLARLDRMRSEGRAPKPVISIPSLWQPSKPTPPKDDAAKKAADAKAAEAQKQAAAAEAKKAAEEAKKLKADMAKAEAAQKNAAKKAAELKKQQDAKRAAEAAKIAKAKAAAVAKAAKKVQPTQVVVEDAKPMTGLKANLTSKAVLLTPVGKKPAAAQSTTTEVSKPASKPLVKVEPKMDDSVETPDDEVVKPAPKKVVKPAEPKVQPAVIKPVKPMKGGLVPPPPPVIPTMQMMVPPPVVPPAKPKAPPPKKVETPKVETPKEDKPAPTHHDPGAGGADDDDFLLDWGNAKGKKK